MFCTKCGNNIPEGNFFCSACGTATPYANITLNDSGDFVKSVFGDKLFLIATILLTVSAGITLFMGALPILQAFIVVAMFMLYSKASKGAQLKDLQSPLKILNGTVLAQQIIIWILVGLCFIASGIIAIVALVIITSNEISIDFSSFEEINSDIIIGFAVALLLIVAVALVIVAVVYILFNIFCLGKMRKCSRSLVVSSETGDFRIEKLNAVKGWLMALGIIGIISALLSCASVPMSAAQLSRMQLQLSQIPEMAEFINIFSTLATTANIGTILITLLNTGCTSVAYILLAKLCEKIKVDKS